MSHIKNESASKSATRESGTLEAPGLTRRQFVGNSATLGAGAATLAFAAPYIRTKPAFGQDMPDPDQVLETITPGNYVPQEYLEQFGIGENDQLWDPELDWIRRVDWEQIRSQFAGETVRFAVGAADAESARQRLEPFRQLSGMDVEVIPIPDANFYDRAIAEFIAGGGRFDALQYFSPWLGDFAGPGYLAQMDEWVEKWSYPLEDFAETYRLNYAFYGNQGIFGLPYDCDFRQVQVRGDFFEQHMGSSLDIRTSLATWDDVSRIASELHGVDDTISGVGFMGGRGFWSTYTWEHIGAHYGLELFDENWQPRIAEEPGIRALEKMIELANHAPQGITGWGWSQDRSAWLGGQLAMNIAWQDQGNQVTRRDQSRIVDDNPTTVFDPRGTGSGARFAPTNIAGSTASVSSNARNPEGAFLAIAFFTTASLQALNGASANGVGAGYKSVLNNERFQRIMPPARVMVESLPYAWAAPRIPGMNQLETSLGLELNRALAGQISARQALENGRVRWEDQMRRNGFYGDNPPLNYADIADRTWLGQGKEPPV